MMSRHLALFWFVPLLIAAPALAQPKKGGRVITISEVTIVGRVQ